MLQHCHMCQKFWNIYGNTSRITRLVKGKDMKK